MKNHKKKNAAKSIKERIVCLPGHTITQWEHKKVWKRKKTRVKLDFKKSNKNETQQQL